MGHPRDSIRSLSGRLPGISSLMALCALLCATAIVNAAEWPDRLHLPIEPKQQAAKLAPSVGQSTKIDWPAEIQAPEGAPNVLVVLMDDVGFGATQSFGGAIPTPSLDRIAREGLRFNSFHTAAVCSPSRAALITGRNHHVASTGIIMEFSTPYPGYHSLVSRSVGTIGEILTDNGYGTSWFGKNHNVPDWQNSPAGPYNLWPTGLGFQYFYGFLGADAHQFRPAVYENITPVDPYLGREDTYHFDADMADHAIKWMHTQKAVWPKKPFFAYYAPGTAHAPHHAPKEWVDKFKGKFDMGWDKLREITYERQKQMGIIPKDAALNPTPKDYKRWDDLSPDMKRVTAREMEVYAGALAHADYQVGRVLDAIDEMGEKENTLVIYIMGDNGSSAEDPTGVGITSEVVTMGNGIPDRPEYMVENIDKFGTMWFQNHYSHGWAHAMNTPFQWDKKIASHLGGSRTGMAISWPGHIKDPGGIRSQFTHINDIVPTILEASHIPAPETINGFKQVPMNGVSLLYTLNDAGAKERHNTQYFEVIANQAIYHDGWLANTTPQRLPWQGRGPTNADPFNDYSWELYNLKTDFTQSKNLANQNPEKLAELRKLFKAEAEKNQVFPLDDRYIERVDPENRPQPNKGRNRFVYFDHVTRITESMAADMKNKSFTITADVTVPKDGGSGIIMTQGGWFGGNALMLLDGKPTYAYALSHYPEHKFRVQAQDKLAAGKHQIVLDFAYDGGGIGKGGLATLTVDGKKVAQGRIDRTIPARISLDETLDIGEDSGTPIVQDYTVPFRFNGEIAKVVIDLKPAADSKAQEQLAAKVQDID
ncbi:Arylsulfatase [Andreprevotia sp. IGB-42]|uniref:arylsulfatase n=1 Tax=Andreprevotia sp. IGB-42 TaxID=2497473 RepID=UPI001357A978|nr:arylsulfatase [Andreprevotia sp. IGB-42]KAF0813323.1 Arylsulfatase [Andreprevotia sp. IGB-42]